VFNPKETVERVLRRRPPRTSADVVGNSDSRLDNS
jgi:hypothetical protein